MVLGIGIDLSSVEDFLLREGAPGFTETVISHTFTDAERAEAGALGNSERKAEYYAGRFAAKEAVFKALSPLMAEDALDLRRIETFADDKGRPRVTITDELHSLLDIACATDIQVSITHDSGMAAAVALVQ